MAGAETKREQRRKLKEEGKVGDVEKAEMALARPKRRSDCVDGFRPCPWVSCRYHLFVEALDSGSLQIIRSIDDLDDAPATCALDVADTGIHSLEEVGEFLGVTRERVRQIETTARGTLVDWAKKARGDE